MKKFLIFLGLIFLPLAVHAQLRGLWVDVSDYITLGDSTVMIIGKDTLTNPAMVRGLIRSIPSQNSDSADYAYQADSSNHADKSDTSNYALASVPDSLIKNSTNEINLDGDTLFAEEEIGKFLNLYSGNLIVEKQKYRNIIVAKEGGYFTTIKEAIDSVNLTGSDTLNRWMILVYPGIYTEDNSSPLKIPSGVSLFSAGGIGTARIIPATTGNLFELSNISAITGFQLEEVNSGSAIVLTDTGSVRIDNMIFQDCDTAITINSPISLIDLRGSFFSNADEEIYRGLNLYAGTVIANQLNVAGTDIVRVPFHIKGSRSNLILNNSTSFSPNVDTFLIAHDSALVIINSTYIANAQNSLFSLTGADVKFNGNSHYNIQNTYTGHDSTGILAGYANNDDNDEAFVIEGQELHIGDHEKGYEVCVGEGDSYSDDMEVWEYNGSTYENVSDSARKVDGLYVRFPNTSVNTAIYIASTVFDTIIHHGIKVGIGTSVTIGSGSIVLEYWNGSTWETLNGMVTDSDPPYIPHAKLYFEQENSTQIRYNIEITNGDWAVNDPMSSGTDRHWVRFRIETAITTTPTIDQIKLHPNRWEANADGYSELFGNSRHSALLPVSIGSATPFEGNMQSQTIYVDENLGVGFQSNRFTATSDKLGFAIAFPKNLDTSSPITLSWSGRSSTAGAIQWTIRWRIITPTSTLYTTEPAASGESFSTVVNSTVTVGPNSIFTADLDVSTAISARSGGYGDQLWISIQPTTLPSTFDLTTLGAEYWTWSEGGHY